MYGIFLFNYLVNYQVNIKSRHSTKEGADCNHRILMNLDLSFFKNLEMPTIQEELEDSRKVAEIISELRDYVLDSAFMAYIIKNRKEGIPQILKSGSMEIDSDLLLFYRANNKILDISGKISLGINIITSEKTDSFEALFFSQYAITDYITQAIISNIRSKFLDTKKSLVLETSPLYN